MLLQNRRARSLALFWRDKEDEYSAVASSQSARLSSVFPLTRTPASSILVCGIVAPLQHDVEVSAHLTYDFVSTVSRFGTRHSRSFQRKRSRSHTREPRTLALRRTKCTPQLENRRSLSEGRRKRPAFLDRRQILLVHSVVSGPIWTFFKKKVQPTHTVCRFPAHSPSSKASTTRLIHSQNQTQVYRRRARCSSPYSRSRLACPHNGFLPFLQKALFQKGSILERHKTFPLRRSSTS